MTTAMAHGGAAGIARIEQRRSRMIREFVTPEGVDLRLEIASAGQRLIALIIDLILIWLILIAGGLVLVTTSLAQWDSVNIIAMLAWFLLNNFWFVMFELGPRAATPGKRIAKIRVVARDGGQLTVAAVVARNLVRQMEILLPLTFLFGGQSGDLASGAARGAALLWALGLGLFLLFNRDRMRLGDIIGGTWVVLDKRRRIAADMAGATSADLPGAPAFSDAELSVYGIYELQELERVLRTGNRDTLIAVSDAIRGKIGREHREDDRVFLLAYYRQSKAFQERNLLFGKRRANKYEDLA